MRDTALTIDPEALLAHSGWVRELARRLATGAEADEVEQATWLAALRGGRHGRASLRGWLGAVARNAARERRRAEGRRAEHEARAARARELPSTLDVVARAELQRRLVGAVLALDEPYRSAILLRWFEELPPRAIAARLGLPVATVRTHLARGLARLRARLDDDHGGDRKAWIAALAPLSSTIDSSNTALGTLLAVNAKIALSCATLTVAAALAWWLAEPRAAAPREAPPALASMGDAAPAAPRGAEFALPEAGEQRVAAQVRGTPGSEPTAAPELPSAAPLAPLSGRVLDEHGRGLAGVRVAVAGAASSAVESAADGAFSLAQAPERGALETATPAFATVLAAPFGPDSRADLHVVAAPRLALAGTVVDERGAPLEGARVELALPADFRARFAVVLDRSQPRGWSARSGADGRFELDGAPRVAGAQLSARADGFAELREPAPAFDELALRLALSRPRSDDGLVRGVVLDSSGAPLAGALVAFGVDAQRSGADGGFAFALDDPASFGRRVGARPERLSAVAQGWLPAVYEPPREGGEPVWPAHVELRLAAPALAIEGRVVDAEDEPMPDVYVYVADATLFGAVDGRVALLETLYTPGDGLWRTVSSDADGRFRLEGLLDRDYVVRAHHPATLLRVDSAPTPAGTRGLELRLPTEALHALVAGRVLSLGGQPIAGATVHPMCDALRVKHEGRTISTSHDATAEAVTDADGRFELRDVPMSLVYLRVDGDQILPEEYGRYVEDDPRFADAEVKELPLERITELEIRVAARCHVQVELARPDLADELAFLGPDGRELVVSLYSAGSRRDTPRHPLHGGRSAVLSAPENAATLVLFRAGQEVDRSPVRLVPGETTHIAR